MIPCPISVTSTTTNVQNSSRSRSGIGAPLSVTNGTAKIAARLTTPRVPAQLSTKISRPLSRSELRSRWPRLAVVWVSSSDAVSETFPSRVCSGRGSDWVSNNHSGRINSTTVTVIVIATMIVDGS